MTMLAIGRTGQKKKAPAFTLVELMGVMVVIGILAGLTVGGASAVRSHGASSRAKAEIAALQAASERYYADNNTYPTNAAMPDPGKDVDPRGTSYTGAGTKLFTELYGTNKLNLAPATKRYFEPKASMVNSSGNPYFLDPWGYAYGYNSDGTNAPLIWSTAGQTNAASTNKWITSWPKM
ncbi:MAG: prepilin-type N-terminal cleavage/methylation domain-containing protein [Bacteroidetes bacterium]|nr:prepilin-type N-terminal cleavage/methylation domain-containing protein [Bacteroidota bacterium]